MKSIRIGNDIRIEWPIVLSGDVSKLQDLDLTVEVRPSRNVVDWHNYIEQPTLYRGKQTVMMNGGMEFRPDMGDGKEHCTSHRPKPPVPPVKLPYHIENNTLIAMWTADRQFAIGDYDIILYAHKNEGGQAVCDQYRFVRLVAHSAQADAPDDSGIEAVITMQPLTLSLSGLSAYEVAVVNGFQGSVEEWLESLKAGKLSSYVSVESIDNLPQQGDESTGYIIGTKLYIYVGTGGDTLEGKYKDVGEFRGPQGAPGSNGKSAYELAVEGGYEGSVEEWLLSLKGRDGVDGVNGADGLDGENGKDGVTPLIRWNNNRIEQSTDNGKSWWALSDKFNNKLYIKGYVTSADKLPKNALVGDMYGVGPIYGDDDVEQTKPYYQVYVNTVTDWAKSATITKVYQGDTELPQSAENNEIILIKKSTDNYLVYKYVNGSWNLLANLAEIYVEKDDIVNKGDNIFALVQSEIENQYELYERVVSWRNSGTFTSITAGIVNELGDSENAVMSQKAVTDELNNINANTGVDGYPAFSESRAYSAGDTVVYNGLLYKFTTDHVAGAWTGTDVEETDAVKAHIVQELGDSENAIMSQKGITEEFNKVNRICFTDNYIANSFIKELYVSTTNEYEKIKLNFYNNYNSVVGIRVSIENDNNNTSLGTFQKKNFYNEETNVFKVEIANLTFICILDWDKLSSLISNGGSLTEVYLTDFAFNKIYSSSLFTQEHIEDKNNPHNVTYIQTGVNPYYSNNIELNKVLKGIWLFEQDIYDSFAVTIFNGQGNNYLLRFIGKKNGESTNIKNFQLSANYNGLVKLDYWGYAYIDLTGTTSNYISSISVINTTEIYNAPILSLLNNNIDLCTTYIDVYPNTSYGIYEDNSGLIFVGIDAIQRAIDYYKNYSNKYNRYVIKVHGQFIVASADDFSSTDNGEYAIAALQSTEYISLKGDGKENTLISAELPDNLGTSFAYNMYSAIIQNGNHTTISDMTISGINCRYTIHTDRSSLDLSNSYEQHIENCRIISNRNTGDAHSVWQSEVPHGIGISDGMKMYMENCEIITDTSVLYLHSNADFDKPFYYKCSNIKCVQRGEDSLKFAHVAAISAGIKGIFELNNINGIGRLDYNESIRSTNATDLADIIISGENNGLIGVVKPNIPKYQLRVSVNDTSVAHTIKFDSSKSAYPLIIQGNNIIGDKLNIIVENGQAYKKGGEGFAAWCIGLLPVPETSYDTNAKLANRLGDCSINNKELGVIIDNNSYSITLDKNYSSMTNDAIISDINAKLEVLDVPCTADLYSISSEVYMDMDSVILLKNLSGKDIVKGLAVKRSAYGFDLATNDKECIGILLDDTCNNSVGRILTKGYISKYGGRYIVSTVGGVLTPNSHYTVNNDSKLEIGTDGEFLAVNSDAVVFDLSNNL